MLSPSSVIPTMRYRDAHSAIAFLRGVLGFEEHLVVPDGAGGVAHAQLRLGGGMVMLGTARDDAYGQLLRQPDRATGVTQAPYVVVPDADAVYARAKAAGWTIVIEIQDEDYGGRGFSCVDPEGHLWNVGTYDPWAAAQR